MKKNVFSLDAKRDESFSFKPLEVTEQGMLLDELELREYIFKHTHVSREIIEKVLDAELDYLTKVGVIRVEE